MRECIEYIYKRVNENSLMSEDELYEVLITSKFFRKLGYKKFGKDVRAQRVVPGKRKKADYVCRDEYQNAVFVLEAKRPSHRTLSDALSQLWNRYVLPLKARYGVLTNGWEFMVYEKIGENPERVLTVDLSKISKKKCDELFRILKKPEYDMTLYSRVEEYFSSVEKLSLKTELAKEDFFETFKLGEDSVFGSLLASLVELFGFVYPKSKFLKGAYGFWQRSLAREPKKIPDSWKPFLKGECDVFRFMFCLETAHALLARLIVAKACEDLDFPGISVSGFTLQKIHHVRGQIPLVAYPLVLISVIREMRDQLVYSLFEDDIFGWWRDGFTEFMQKSSSELLQESVDKRLEDFSETAAKVIFMLYKFDFGEVAGDPLGDLYQKYFNKDTRKALGEFYTPVEVVNYILDAVGYENIEYKRLLDPACGSGTFIVEALKRYLTEAKRKAKKHGWAYVLRELCNSPKIVGFDIHPFACLIARTRFMLELIPYFKKALEEEAPRLFYLQRIPVFRTDSLAIEMVPPEFRRQRELAEAEEDIVFPVTLPMRIDSESSMSVSIILPSWRKILSHALPLYNLDEYFCTLQAVFDAVKSLLEVEAERVPETSLKAYLQEYLENKDFGELADFFKPYADQILDEIIRIQSEFEDGRLIKSIEDAVLASLLKNYLRYDFVLGNPPYVRIQELPGAQKEYLRQYYKSARGSFDIYIPFLERGVKWLNEYGKLGFITSNQYMVTHYGKILKRIILNNTKILQMIDFRDSGVFEEVTNYPAIIILERISKKDLLKKNVIKAVIVFRPMENILEDIRKNIGKKEHLNEFYSLFDYPQAKLNVDIWKLMPTEEIKIFEKIEKNANFKLKDITERVFQGLRTSANKIYLAYVINEEGKDPKTNKNLVRIKPIGEDFEYIIEKDLLKPFLKGEEIRRWKVTWRGLYVIHPYKLLRNKDGIIIGAQLYSQEELQKEFPHTWKYYLAHKNELENRERGRMRGCPDWYGYIYPKNLDKFERPKIIFPNIINTNSFTYDGEGWYFTAGYAVLLEGSISFEDYAYILALLNSKVLEFYFKHIATIKSGKYYDYRSQYVEKFPIKLPETLEEEIPRQVIQKVERTLQQIGPQRLIERFPETYISEYRLKGEEFNEIDYTFSAGHTGLKPFLSGLPSNGYVVYPSEGEDSIWVDTKEKARYLALALRNRKVKQNDIIKILIPRDNSIVIEILERVKKTVQEVKATPIDQLEEEINELVYQLYGLNEDDKAVIESFLTKF